MLCTAASDGNLSLVQKYVDEGANVNEIGDGTFSPLFCAVDGVHLKVVRFLLSVGANSRHQTIDKQTILHILADSRNIGTHNQTQAIELWKLFLTSGLSVDAVNEAGETPLHLLCLRGQVSVLQFLLSNKHITQLNPQTNSQDTPLHYASRKGDCKLIQLLVQFGADLTLQSSSGTPLQVVQGKEAVTLLTQLQAKSKDFTLLNIPYEILLHICNFISSPLELLMLSQTCSTFYSVIKDDILWKHFISPQWVSTKSSTPKSDPPLFKDMYVSWLNTSIRDYKSKTATALAPSTPNPAYDFLFKYLLIGDSGVGKSSFLLRFTEDTFTDSYISTIGVDFKIKTIEINNLRVKLQIWDTAGPERFRTITSAYYRGMTGGFMIYDMNDLSTLHNLDGWINEVKKYSTNNPSLVLVGTKSDLERRVDEETICNFAEKYNIPHIETSSKFDINVHQAVLLLTQNVLGRHGLFCSLFGGVFPAYVPTEDELKKFGIVSRGTQGQSTDNKQKKKDDKCHVS